MLDINLTKLFFKHKKQYLFSIFFASLCVPYIISCVPPVAEDMAFGGSCDQSFSTCINESYVGQLLPVEMDAYTIVNDPKNGSLTIDANGQFTYTPAGGFIGQDQFTFTVTNSDGCISNPATVNITVNTVVAEAQAFSTCINQVYTGQLLPVGMAQYIILDEPIKGTLILDNSSGSFTYTPMANYSGIDNFSFATQNNGCTSDTATVNINVNGKTEQNLSEFLCAN